VQAEGIHHGEHNEAEKNRCELHAALNKQFLCTASRDASLAMCSDDGRYNKHPASWASCCNMQRFTVVEGAARAGLLLLTQRFSSGRVDARRVAAPATTGLATLVPLRLRQPVVILLPDTSLP
jgi:hypothetical protein